MVYLDYWKPIKGYEGKYSASYWGYIRSWDCYLSGAYGRVYLKKGRILKPGLTKKGYLKVTLCNGKKTSFQVHRLVAETFISNPNNYPQINHNITPTKTINCVHNIEWCTSSHNIKHAFKNGRLARKGERCNLSKLVERQVKEIKLKLLRGCRGIDLAKEYSVDNSAISNIKSGKNWRHVVLT